MIDPRLAQRIANVDEELHRSTGSGLEIISGFRTETEQDALRRAGRPTAPPGVSTHTLCPASGVDISLAGLVTDDRKATFGRIAQMNGLRWGGGSSLDQRGIPSDWNHVDLGPRI